MPAQLTRPVIDGFRFRGRIPIDSHQRRAEGRLHVQLLLAVLGSVREGVEQLQPLGELADGFQIG